MNRQSQVFLMKGERYATQEDEQATKQERFSDEVWDASEEYECWSDAGRYQAVAMPCFHPLKAWRAAVRGPSGTRRMVFDPTLGYGPQVDLPCGQCIGCRLEHSRQWAVRCMHEASLYDDNCFLTLTYRPEDLPKDGSLDKRHYQLFMKRLRKYLGDRKVRYFQCGEYGENFSRPHYHACLFGFDFPDKVHFSNAGGTRLYTSDLLNDIWGLGFCTLGDVTFESAAYVARYVTKKVTGDAAKEHYLQVDENGEIATDSDGNLVCRQPEYVTMSRKPGIAREWFKRFVSDVFPHDEVIARGHPCKPPRYYDELFKSAHPEEFAKVQGKRVSAIRKHAENCTPERLYVREVVAKARMSSLKRGFES